jgi:hypothetical protein
MKTFVPGCTFENGVFTWRNAMVEVKAINPKLETEASVIVSGIKILATSVQLTQTGVEAEFTVTAALLSWFSRNRTFGTCE